MFRVNRSHSLDSRGSQHHLLFNLAGLMLVTLLLTNSNSDGLTYGLVVPLPSPLTARKTYSQAKCGIR